MMDLRPVDRRTGLTRETFADEYLKPMKPVVFTDLTASWPARQRWTIEHFKKQYGHLRVPVVSNNYSKPGRGYMRFDRVISFKEYLEILESGPNDLRIFLWNIFRVAPELRNDFRIPDIMDGFVDELPFMFFGGECSRVALHYDIDMSHVFLNQIHGRKRIILFPPDQSVNLYHHPFTVASYVDLNHPDYVRYPALAQIKRAHGRAEGGWRLAVAIAPVKIPAGASGGGRWSIERPVQCSIFFLLRRVGR